MRILIVGGYGFIGQALCRELLRRGHDVRGFGRSAMIGRRLLPQVDWIEGDLMHERDAVSWHDALAGCDAVVNASGALQDGGGGRLKHIQADAIIALITACVALRVARFIQISAPGAEIGADTAFMATKAAADSHLRRSSLDWTILRPALVIGSGAYGGTALIRALAVLPVALTVYGDRVVQCVALGDVAIACADAVDGVTPPAQDISLAAPESLTLREVIAEHRNWLGLRRAHISLDFPPVFAVIPCWLADLAGWMGWRSPLRSTAFAMMRRGVVVERPSAASCRSLRLAGILAARPAGVQDRMAARAFMLLPLVIFALSTLWIGSGIVGLIKIYSAATFIGGGRVATWLVRICSVVDVLLGIAILFRPVARRTAFAMAAISAGYLIAGSMTVPDLWLDPLAPLLKIVPAFILALVATAMLDER